ncbi:hypothetical protein ACH3XW_18755 [Acanthocheilonema viteae]
MLLQRNDVIARWTTGKLLVAPCKTTEIPRQTIEFNGGLISKFEIEKSNAELKLLSNNHATLNFMPHQQVDEFEWEELTKEGQQLANQLADEFDRVSDSIQQEVEIAITHWKLIIICIIILIILIVLVILKLKLDLLKTLLCPSHRRNSRSNRVIFLPTNSVNPQTLNNEAKRSVIKLSTFSYTPEEYSFELPY